MAIRRMFSKVVTSSDQFLDLPATSRLLYYDLGMNADDDGFVQARSVMRLTGASADDVSVLIAKKFLIPFEDGVIVIKDWKVNNEIRSDRYKPTFYIEHKSRLEENQQKQYGLGSTKGVPEVVPNGDIWDTQVRLGKVRLGKKGNGTPAKKADVPRSAAELTAEHMQAVADKYQVPLTAVEALREELEDYVASTGKKYHDYRAVLRTWTRRKIDKGELKGVTPSKPAKREVYGRIGDKKFYSAEEMNNYQP